MVVAEAGVVVAVVVVVTDTVDVEAAVVVSHHPTQHLSVTDDTKQFHA